MKKMLVGTAFAVALVPLSAFAGPIEGACIKSDRKAVSRNLCGCIQQVADMTLTGSDQRRAAKFFRDPDEAQNVRMSKSDRDNEFWARYRSFGEMAEVYCAG
jgi:hypothetical protein